MGHCVAVGSSQIPSLSSWRNASSVLARQHPQQLLSSSSLFGRSGGGFCRPYSSVSLLPLNRGVRVPYPQCHHRYHPLFVSVSSPRIGSLSYFSSYNNNNNNNNLRPPSNNNHRRMGALGMMGTGAVVLFGKTKYILGALKVTKLARYVWMCLCGWMDGWMDIDARISRTKVI
jgi:hypothetical protein